MRLSLDRFFVKICGITSEEDALMSIGLGASAVGFVLAPSPRQMSAQAVHDIVRRLPPEAVTVGVFRNERPETVCEVANSIGLTAVQLHGNETMLSVEYVRERVRTVIRALPFDSPRLDDVDAAGLDYLLLDAAAPGSGRTFDWSILGRRLFATPVIAAGGLTPENVVEVVRDYPVFGVDVASGVESASGVKDPARVADFVAAARWAFEQRDEGLDDRPFDWSKS